RSREKERDPGPVPPDEVDQPLEVGEGLLVADEMAARAPAPARAAAIGRDDADAARAQHLGRLGEPTGVARDPVEEDQHRPRVAVARPLPVVDQRAIVRGEESPDALPDGELRDGRAAAGGLRHTRGPSLGSLPESEDVKSPRSDRLLARRG